MSRKKNGKNIKYVRNILIVLIMIGAAIFGYDMRDFAYEDKVITPVLTPTTQPEISTQQYVEPTKIPAEIPAENEFVVSDFWTELDKIPVYSESPYVAINGNVPYFTDADITTKSYETYADLDSLGRCGVTMACIGQDLMPTEKRGDIGSVKPTGWVVAKYDFVDGKYLYNRCHLIGFQLTAENANENNLITGTRYMNVQGMLPFENMVADYIKETGNHVLYRVTPIFEGDNLVASGVLMEAKSVEDDGEGIEFNVYCYNVQPGVGINYETGESWEEGLKTSNSENSDVTYILNTNSKKIHLETCAGANSISEKNKEIYHGDIELLKLQGYSSCSNCNP